MSINEAIQEKTDYKAELDRAGSLLSDRLYSNPTHFVYELLQNAEDAEATKVIFRLYQDRLELEHDGQPFTKCDVRGIRRFGAGTKENDITKIGTFGIGFKSVYAHTCSPEIHSGAAHFAIDHYVDSRSIPPRSSDLGTLFVFPFNRGDRDPGKSFDKISERLKDLGTDTLLFLKNIMSISYEIDESNAGSCHRKTSSLEANFVREVTVIRQSNQRKEERWLVFERDVDLKLIPEDELKDASIPEGKSLTVEIAFLYADPDSQGSPKFQHPPKSNLVVYFPTEKETHLGFLMQGPYRTTPARDNIPQSNAFNITLAEQTGDLVVETLRWLRDKNWLTVDVLTMMPLAYTTESTIYGYSWNHEHNYRNTLFEPVYKKVLAAIKNEDLIPAYKEGYVSGKNAKLAGSEALRVLLNGSRLREFFDNDQLRWISGKITGQLRYYLIHHVDIEEIDSTKFARRIDKEFLRCQPDSWIREFYEFASEHDSITSILKNKPIIRLQKDSNHVAPFDRYSDKPNAYLPTEHESQFDTVKREVCNSDKAMEFLRNLGLKKPDIVDEVTKLILPKYEQDNEIDIEEHRIEERRKDITVIVKALNEVPRDREDELIQDLKQSPFLLATNAKGVKEFRCPVEIYRRTPELEMYFEGNPEVWFLSSEYASYADDFEKIGVASQVRVCCKKPDNRGYVDRSLRYHRYRRGYNGFDPDCSIEGLEFALEHSNLKRAKFIWDYLLKYQRCIVGIVEESSRQDFSSAGRVYSKEEQVSKMGKLVREKPWLPNPNKQGEFVVPKEITLDELPDDFSKDKQLAAKLGMNASYEAIVAELQGREDIPEELKQAFKSTLELKQKCPELLDNPEELNKYMRWRESTAKQTTNEDNSIPGEEVKQRLDQRLEKADQYKELERKYPELLAELMREAATEQTNEDNSILDSADSPGHGTGNVPHNESRTVRQSGGTHINNGSQSERRDTEKAAMKAVMQKEKDLGNTPYDVSNKRGLGYDIESHTPGGGSRFIEVKGYRSDDGSDDGSVTLTRNEVRCALDKPEQFILALVKVVDDCPESPRYLPGNSWLESVTFSNLRKLLELCQDPS